MTIGRGHTLIKPKFRGVAPRPTIGLFTHRLVNSISTKLAAENECEEHSVDRNVYFPSAIRVHSSEIASPSVMVPCSLCSTAVHIYLLITIGDMITY